MNARTNMNARTATCMTPPLTPADLNLVPLLLVF